MTVSFTLRLVLISLFLTYLERSETLWSQSKLLTSTTKLRNRFSHSLVCLLWRISSSPLTSGCRYGSVNSSCAQPPPPQATLGHLPTLSVLGVGHLQILCTAQGPGIGQPQGQPQTFDTHGFLSEYNYTEDFTGKTSRLAHLLRTEKLNRVGNVCSQFYACISSLLIKPELHSEIGIYWQESTFFWLLNQICVNIIWRTSFCIYKTIPNSQLYRALLILKLLIL